MSFIEKVYEKAKKDVKTIVLPEGDEIRTITAAAEIAKEGLARPILLGNQETVRAMAAEAGIDLSDIAIIDPDKAENAAAYAAALYEIRKNKGMTPEKAEETVKDPMYYGIMMVKEGDADGLVSGAVHSTGDMLRPALQIIKTKPGTKTVSSSFIMECPNKSIGEDGVFIISDGVVVPCPTAEELAHIAVDAAATGKALCGFEVPKVAMLSFSTKGSAKHELVTKVQEAVSIAHTIAPDLLLDGELQLDAAVVPEIGQMKAKGSPVAGYANVLIFPDLQAGNIGYKLVQRVAGAEAFAVLQGLAKPCNDLSRGCSAEDIVKTVACTAVQAQEN